nr:MAG TPA: hypothetical protein [Caudoviricetes sp.]
MWMLRIRFKNRKGELTTLRYDRDKAEDAINMLLEPEVKDQIIAHYRDYPSPVLVEVASTERYKSEYNYKSIMRGDWTFGQLVAAIYDTLWFEERY